MTAQSATQNKYAVITAIYKSQKYSSMPLELIPNSDNMRLLMTLSEVGTSTSNMIKFPVSATSFMVFSKEQLNETLFEIEITDMLPKAKKKKDTIIKS